MNNKQRHGYTRKTSRFNNNNNQYPNNNRHHNPNMNHNNQNMNQNMNSNMNHNVMQNQGRYDNKEIRKLTETVFDLFSDHYIQYSPTYQEIYKIIEKDPPANINSNTVLRVITTVKRYYEDKIEKQTPKIEPVDHFEYEEIKPSNDNIIVNELKLENSGLIPSNRYLDNNRNPIALPPPSDGGFQVPAKAEEIMDTGTSLWHSYVVIDSKDRDTERFEAPNNFTIDLSPDGYTSANERKGYIKRGFHNIVSIELISCMLLDTSGEVDSSDATAPPAYVILEIPELSRNLYGTNDDLSTGFDILTTYNTQGNYKYFNMPLNFGPEPVNHKYDHRINLNKLTVKFKLPNGDLYDFGANNNSNTNTVNQIVLKITQLKHQITTSFLHKENS